MLMTGSQTRKLLPKYRKYRLWQLSDIGIDGEHRIFTFAAVDTTSSALARTLWVLSQRQDAQEKLRLEIREARKSRGDLAYDELMSLPYLDAVCRETLRL